MSGASRATLLAAVSALVLAGGTTATAGLAAARHHAKHPSPSGRHSCAHRPAPARLIWAPAFPRPSLLGYAATASSLSRTGARRAAAPRCPPARHGGGAGHGVPATTPASGTAAPSTGQGGAPAAGKPSAPAGSPPPAEGAGGESPAPPSVPHVGVTSVEYHFTLSRTTVPAGKVIFDFVNAGQDEHNLNVLSVSEGEIAGSFPNTVSKGVREQAIVMRHGSYTLFCSLPEHEAKGMRATLTVE